MTKCDSVSGERSPLAVDYRRPADLRPYDKNARVHSDAQVEQIAASMLQFGFNNPVLLKDDEATIGAGHGRLAAAELILSRGQRLPTPDGETIPTITLRGLTEPQWRAYVLADNQLALNATWDEDLLRGELEALRALDFDVDLIGFDTADLEALFNDAATSPRSGALAERFLGVPFSVLSARDGWWRARKAAWLSLGLRSELGRGEVMGTLSSARKAQLAAPGRSAMPAADYSKSKKRGDGAGRAAPEEETWVTSSIFDPVLCELAYRWFCPVGGQVLDPFAGGSVRGVVAGRLGRPYYGIDLRPEQVEENRRQAAEILGDPDAQPTWAVGDSAVVLGQAETPDADFVFSCPPYADLEVYSDDPRDLSTMGYDDFLAVYRQIIARACAKLKPDRFACFVVADIRDPAGLYRDFVGETVRAFRDAGLALYNEAILVTAIGSLPVRAGKQFAATRKLGKTHQNVLVFVKGDPRKATEACGVVEVGEIEADED